MASGSKVRAAVEAGEGTVRGTSAVLLRAQLGAGTVAGVGGPELGTRVVSAPQLFTFSSSTSNTSAESGPMSRPAPRLP